jgi:hypothetical protein
MNLKNTALVIMGGPFLFFVNRPNAGPKIQRKDSLGPSVLTESDSDEYVMSSGNSH